MLCNLLFTYYVSAVLVYIQSGHAVAEGLRPPEPPTKPTKTQLALL